MTTNLTKEAAEGFTFSANNNTFAMTLNQLVAACPYLHTSPAALAWHLGRFLQTEGEPSPRAEDLSGAGRREVMASRGDSMVMRGRKQIELGRFDTRDGIIYRRTTR